MENIVDRKFINHNCDKCKSHVRVLIETVGVMGGDSNVPIHTFDRGKCQSFPKVSACYVCDYRP